MRPVRKESLIACASCARDAGRLRDGKLGSTRLESVVYLTTTSRSVSLTRCFLKIVEDNSTVLREAGSIPAGLAETPRREGRQLLQHTASHQEAHHRSEEVVLRDQQGEDGVDVKPNIQHQQGQALPQPGPPRPRETDHRPETLVHRAEILGASAPKQLFYGPALHVLRNSALSNPRSQAGHAGAQDCAEQTEQVEAQKAQIRVPSQIKKTNC